MLRSSEHDSPQLKKLEQPVTEKANSWEWVTRLIFPLEEANPKAL